MLNITMIDSHFNPRRSYTAYEVKLLSRAACYHFHRCAQKLLMFNPLKGRGVNWLHFVIQV